MDVVSDVINGQRFVRTESVGCPICAEPRVSRAISAQFGMTAHVAICPACRLAFQTPRPSPDATLAYMNWRWSSSDSYVGDVEAQLSRAKQQLDMVRSCISRPSSLLDFGAGSGSFVKIARDSGWAAQGVERSLSARKNAADRYGVDLSENFPDKKFDVITMWDVIEHLRAPAEMLANIFNYLAPGGYLFIETGNWENWQRVVNGDKWHVYLFDHHFYFSPSSLSQITTSAGYEGFRLLDVNRISPGGMKDFRKMPRYTLQSWVAWISSNIKWGSHADVHTMVAVVRRPVD